MDAAAIEQFAARLVKNERRRTARLRRKLRAALIEWLTTGKGPKGSL